MVAKGLNEVHVRHINWLICWLVDRVGSHQPHRLICTQDFVVVNLKILRTTVNLIYTVNNRTHILKGLVSFDLQ